MITRTTVMTMDNEENYSDEMEVLGDIGTKKEQEHKNLRTILNRGKMDKFELEEFMHGEV